MTSAKTRGIINGISSEKALFTDSDGHYAELIDKIDFNDKRTVAISLIEFENKYKNSNIEHCRVITINGDIYEVHGELDLVNTDMLGDLMKGSINEHNHVTGESQYSFSWEDLKLCVKDGTNTALAFDEKYRYSIVFPDKVISADDLDDAYENAKCEVWDIRLYDRFYKRLTIPDENVQHEIVKRTCERLGIKYERQEKR